MEVLLILVTLLIGYSDCLTCYKRSTKWNNGTCTGDYCLAVTFEVGFSPIQDCYSGSPIPIGCYVNYDDLVICVCNSSSYCNTPHIVTSPDITKLPVFSCLDRGSVGESTCVSNECKVTITGSQDRILSTEQQCNFGSMTYQGFPYQFNSYSSIRFQHDGVVFIDGCYNYTDEKTFYTYACRCTQNQCNSNWEYVYNPRVRCQLANGVYNETESTGYCYGDLCFIWTENLSNGETDGTESPPKYRKGCISYKQNGPVKLKPGYYAYDVTKYYFCATDNCNANVASAVESYSKPVDNSTTGMLDNSTSSDVQSTTPGDAGSFYGCSALSAIVMYLLIINIVCKVF